MKGNNLWRTACVVLAILAMAGLALGQAQSGSDGSDPTTALGGGDIVIHKN